MGNKASKIQGKASGIKPPKLPESLRNFKLIDTGIDDFNFLHSLTELTYLELFEEHLSDQILSIISTSCTKLVVLKLDIGKFNFFYRY